MRSKIVLVTGGAGFIGSHLVDALIKKGYGVRILDSLEKPVHLKGKPEYMPEEAEFILGDVRKKEDWERGLDGVSAVFHLAAYQDYLPDFSKFFHVNTVGTALLYEVAVERNIALDKVVIASSQAVYGEGRYRCLNDACPGTGALYYPDIRSPERLAGGDWEHGCPDCEATLKPQPTDESTINPQNQYALSKYSQEMIGFNLGRRYSIPTVAMRYSIVQGPRQSFYNAYSGACRIFCLSYFFDKPPVIYEDGDQIRDFVNINDVVDANLLVLEKDEADYQVFNVGGGTAYTVREFAGIVKNVFEKELDPRIPGEYRFGDTRHIVSDIQRLKGLGWAPVHSPEKSVRDYAAWLKGQVDIDDVLEYAERKMKEMNVVRKAKRPI
jgi:dTDP-L-rhamnose 4-epimerase